MALQGVLSCGERAGPWCLHAGPSWHVGLPNLGNEVGVLTTTCQGGESSVGSGRPGQCLTEPSPGRCTSLGNWEGEASG